MFLNRWNLVMYKIFRIYHNIKLNLKILPDSNWITKPKPSPYFIKFGKNSDFIIKIRKSKVFWIKIIVLRLFGVNW